jgi:hypothetical protein
LATARSSNALLNRASALGLRASSRKPVHRHGPPLKPELQFIEMIVKARPAALGLVDRQARRLVDHQCFTVFE